MIRTIIVDDHVLFRMGTRLALHGESGIEIVGEAASGKELFHLLKTVQPDVVLLDILLPDISGIEIARKLKKEFPEIKILILSAENPASIIEQILEMGIEGYVTKSTEIKEIENAIVSIANGLEYFGRDIAKVIYEIVALKRKQKEKTSVLTNRETEVVRLCSEGLLSKEIAFRLKISYHTVDFHKNNIFRKLGINNSVELAKFAIKNGIVCLLAFLFFFTNLYAQKDDYENGKKYFFDAKNDSALLFLDKAIISPIDSTDYKRIAETHLLRSQVLGNLTFFERSMNDALKALEIGKKHDMASITALSLLGIGKVHFLMYNDSIAKEYYLKAKEFAESHRLEEELMHTNYSVAQFCLVHDQNEEGLALIEKTYEMAKTQRDTVYLIQSLYLFGTYYTNLNRWTDPIIDEYQKKSKHYFDEALLLALEKDIPMFVNNIYFNLIRYYRVEKNYPEALRYANLIIEQCEPTNYGMLIQVYDQLVGVYAHLGDAKMIKKSHQEFYTLMRKQSDYNLHQSLQEMKVKYETAEKELEISRQSLVINRQVIQRAILFFGLLLMIITVALLWYFLRLRSKLARELAEMNATKDKFFSIISHDLKNPAIAQRNALQGLIDHWDELDKQSLEKYYSELLKSADSQIELLYNLLNWAQVQTGRMPFKPEMFDLSKVIDDEIDLLHPLLDNKNIEIETDLSSCAEVFGDHTMIAVVIRNLLNNAAKFTPKGGKISIKVSHDENGKWQITVSDNGIGMDDETKENIFKLDSKSSRVGTNGEPGSGLGLIVCKELLEKHNSKLSIDSEEGKGSRFWFTI